MSKFRQLYYVSGADDPSIRMPGENYNLKLTTDGIKFYHSRIVGNSDLKSKKQFISWDNVIGVGAFHTTRHATSLGSLLGATTKTRDSKLIIRYKSSSGHAYDLIMGPMLTYSKTIDKARDAIHKKLVKLGRNEESININLESGGQKSGYLNELEKLAELRKKGVLTQQEYDAKKKQLLGL